MPNLGALSLLSSREGFGSPCCRSQGSSGGLLFSACVNAQLLTQLKILSTEDKETWGISPLCL